MNYIKSPLKDKKQKPNRRAGISGGEPAKRKRKPIFSSSAGTAGSSAAGQYGRRKTAGGEKKESVLATVKPWKVIATSILIGICGLLYITHVFSTQQTLREVQQLENEFNKAQRLYNEQRLQYDRMIGPKQIYQQAQEQGFINAGPADQIIIIDP